MSRLFLYIAAFQMIINMNSEELKQKIEQVTENWSFTKYNLMRMGTLVKLIDEVEKHAPTCAECKAFQHELPHFVEQIPQLDEAYTRSDYEKKFNAMRAHFHKAHKFFAPSHFSSRYALLGILLFALVGVAISFVQQQKLVADYLLFGSTAGLMIGYSLGSIRDLKIRKNNKLI